MSILEIIKSRRSIRQFQDKEIPTKVIKEITEAILWAPSAGNLQARKFYFITNQEVKKRLAQEGCRQNFIAQAPLVVVGCADLEKIDPYSERGRNLYCLQDVTTSIQNLMLVLDEEGLGSCWVGAFDENKVKEILDLPSSLRPVVILPIGWPAEEPLPPPRLPKDKVIIWM